MKYCKMRNIIIFLTLLLSISVAKSQLNNANEGKKFLVTFPQNEYRSSDLNDEPLKLGIYISSQTDADITITNHHNNKVITRAVRANDFVQIDNFELGRREDIEDLSDGVISNKVIEITSDEYISVSIVNSKETSSDGYLAYPVEEWGNNYIHNSMYHARFSGINRSSGFTIIADKNYTKVKLLLKGKNPAYGTTKSGDYKVGDTISLELDANQSFSVKTDSRYNGIFDLSGSLIISNKPVGVISFHERTKIPQKGAQAGMDNLIEMQQPLSNWRNKFVSIDLGRDYGDFFRVLPLEDETNLTITSYKEDGTIESKNSHTLNTGGDFYEYNNSEINRINSREEQGIIGNTIWEADKPILVTQYSYSYSWEQIDWSGSNDNIYDPFMLNLINEEQFTKNVRFLAPPYGDFETHKVNLVIKIDSTKPSGPQLESIIFDDQYLYQIHPELLSNRIGNTDYYWLRFDVSSGVHNIESDVRLAAFLYGFGAADSYGMQTALGNLELVDTLLTIDNSIDCDEINIEYNIKSTFGLNNQSLESYNFVITDFELIEYNNFDYNIELSEDKLSLILSGRLTNPALPMNAVLSIVSETGKQFYDTLSVENYNRIMLTDGVKIQSFPGSIISFPISINESKDTLDYLIDYNFSFIYKPAWLNVNDIFIDGISRINDTIITNYTNSTEISFSEPILREYITGGNEIIIEVQTLLNRDTILTPTILLSRRYNDICYTGVSDIEVNSTVCAHDLRQVELFNSDYVEIQSTEIIALESTNISIFDVLGKEVVQGLQISKSQKVNLNNYLNKKGLYIIRINNSEIKAPIKYFHR